MDKNFYEVYFLGKNYTVPTDALVFLESRELVSNIVMPVIETAFQIEQKYSNTAVEDFFDSTGKTSVEAIKHSMRNAITKLISSLLDKGIYEISTEEMESRTDTLVKVDLLFKDTVNKVLAETRKIVELKNRGMDAAYNISASTITGSGMGIITNSTTSLLAYSIIENRIIKSQIARAEKEYEKKVARLGYTAKDNFTRMCSTYFYKVFMPGLVDIIKEFHDDMYTNYLLELAQHDLFNIKKVTEYSENKSTAILNNLSRVTNKTDALIQAFEMCPFNISVYEKLLEYNEIDLKTMQDAENTFPKNDLKNLVENQIQNNLQDVQKVRHYIPILTLYTNKSEKELLQKYYSSQLKKLKDMYTEVSELYNNSEKLKIWIRNYISIDLEEVLKQSRSDIETSVTQWIKQTIKDTDTNFFLEYNVIKSEELIPELKNETDCEIIKQKCIIKIVHSLEKYIKEIEQKKELYYKAYEPFNKILVEKEKKISEKKAELNQLGFFSFSQKKKVKSELTLMKEDLETFKKTEPITVKEDYLNM